MTLWEALAVACFECALVLGRHHPGNSRQTVLSGGPPRSPLTAEDESSVFRNFV